MLKIAIECSNRIRRSSLGNAFVCVHGARSFREGDGWIVQASLNTLAREASTSTHQRTETALAELEENGRELSLDYQERIVPGADNDPEPVERADAAMKTVLGDDGVRRQRNIIQFTEDFGFFQEQVPGAMYFLGVSNSAKGWVGAPHTPTYVADEEAFFIGAKAMAAVFLDLFEHPLEGTR